MPALSRRILAWSMFGAAVIGALAWSFWPRAIPVEVASLGYGPLKVEVSDEARTRVRETYRVSAPVAGKLLRIQVHAGDTVTAEKSVVADLLPMTPSFLDVRSRAQAENAVKSAQAAAALAAAELQKAGAQRSFAAAELGRATRLSAFNAIARTDFERAQLAYNTAIAQESTAKAALAAKRFDLETAKALLIDPANLSKAQRERSSIQLRAPVTGKVLRVLRESESVVIAGVPILELGNPRDLEVLAELISEDAVKVHEGDRARITDWGGPGELSARVRRVEPSGFTKVSALGVQEQRVNVLLDFTDPEDKWVSVADGFRVIVHIVVWERARVLRLPASAMFRGDHGWAVFAVRGGRARLVHVTVGRSNDEFAELQSGLSAGERVIVHPSDRIHDGALVGF